MKVAISGQPSAFSTDPVWQSVATLRTVPFFRNRHARRFHILRIARERRT